MKSLKRKIAICFFTILFFTLFLIFFLPFNTKKNDLDTNNVRKILLRSGIVKSSITYIKILYQSKKTSRSECGWNIILEITPADVEFSKLTLLDAEAGKLFIEWLKTEEEFLKNLSLTHLKSIKVYRPRGTDGIGFPALLCNDQKCIVLLYNSKP